MAKNTKRGFVFAIAYNNRRIEINSVNEFYKTIWRFVTEIANKRKGLKGIQTKIKHGCLCLLLQIIIFGIKLKFKSIKKSKQFGAKNLCFLCIILSTWIVLKKEKEESIEHPGKRRRRTSRKKVALVFSFLVWMRAQKILVPYVPSKPWKVVLVPPDDTSSNPSMTLPGFHDTGFVGGRGSLDKERTEILPELDLLEPSSAYYHSN
jgi:hypothetical protein